jgi:hypothetical protein
MNVGVGDKIEILADRSGLMRMLRKGEILEVTRTSSTLFDAMDSNGILHSFSTSELGKACKLISAAQTQTVPTGIANQGWHSTPSVPIAPTYKFKPGDRVTNAQGSEYIVLEDPAHVKSFYILWDCYLRSMVAIDSLDINLNYNLITVTGVSQLSASPNIGTSSPVTPLSMNAPVQCSHDWRDSRTDGFTKWCSICGERR